MCIPVADSCWYMVKPIQYYKVKKIIIIFMEEIQQNNMFNNDPEGLVIGNIT